jgi:hypothetical protein
MSMSKWEYNSSHAITRAGPPQNDFLFKGVKVCHKCLHFSFFHNTRGCEAQKLSLVFPSKELVLGPCYCWESNSVEAQEELLRIGKANGFDLAEGNTQAPLYLGKSPDMRVSLPHGYRRSTLGRWAE